MSLDIQQRIKETTVFQWIKAAIAVVVYILFIAWVGNFWWLLLAPFFFDVYVTKIVPWGWWKKLKNKTLRTVMGWVDAIVFSLVAVYFVFAFLFQNYQIPTSSLEKTLLVGDFLFVSKAHYGPRVPMTPLSFPLAQHTMPVVGGKSYIECPQWEYRRLKGLTMIKRDDIVVFNFPTGDTVPELVSNPDYYTLCYRAGYSVLKMPYTAIEPSYDECITAGRKIVTSDKRRYGEILYRPVDRRENYVKRCVGLPGDSLKVVDNQIFVNGEPQAQHAGIQFGYFVQTDGVLLNDRFLHKLGVSKDDIVKFEGGLRSDLVAALGLEYEKPVYWFVLTHTMKQQLENTPEIRKIVIEPDWLQETVDGKVFPLAAEYGWSRDNYGTIYIPKKGDNLEINLENLPIYERIISVYENNKLEVRDSTIYINDVAATHYPVKMDYYWMMGDNRHRSADSRYWGFVPEDHVVGCPLFVWLSWDKDKGGIRWNRFFAKARR